MQRLVAFLIKHLNSLTAEVQGFNHGKKKSSCSFKLLGQSTKRKNESIVIRKGHRLFQRIVHVFVSPESIVLHRHSS